MRFNGQRVRQLGCHCPPVTSQASLRSRFRLVTTPSRTRVNRRGAEPGSEVAPGPLSRCRVDGRYTNARYSAVEYPTSARPFVRMPIKARAPAPIDFGNARGPFQGLARLILALPVRPSAVPPTTTTWPGLFRWQRAPPGRQLVPKNLRGRPSWGKRLPPSVDLVQLIVQVPDTFIHCSLKSRTWPGHISDSAGY